jgi:hypothetical protein
MATTKTGKTRRPGSGRTVGSYSFVKLSIADLLSKFADHTTPVIVSRKWAEQLGFQGLTATTAGATTDKIEGMLPTTKVEVRVKKFSDEE